MTPQFAQIVLLIYGILVAAGGIMGFAKAGSVPSLAAGVGFGVLAVVGAAVSKYGAQRPGLILGALAALVVMGAMGSRFAKSRTFMPAGLTLILSLVTLVIVVAVILRTRAV